MGRAWNLALRAFSRPHGAAGRAAALVLGVCLLWAAPAWPYGQPVAPSQEEREALEGLKGQASGEIVFSSRRDGKWRLFRILPDGTDLARLSKGTANHTRPFFILGGAKLLYHSDQDGPSQIWIADPDLGNPRRISPEGQAEVYQGITADGKRMLVARAMQPPDYVLRELNGDLSRGHDTPVDFASQGLRTGRLDGMMSPDGRKVAFQYKGGDSGEPGRAVYVVDLAPDGRTGGLRHVANGCFTSWRADSQAFLTCQFATFRGLPGTEIWLADDREAREQLTTNMDWNYFPAFSPDERWMVWAASPLYSHDHATGKYEIYVKRLRDRHPVRLTFHTAPDEDPTWRAGRSKLKGHGIDFVYEAEDYAHAPATTVADPAASGGQVAFVPRDAGKAGGVIYGQYDVLAPGRYVATFRLRLSAPRSQGLAAELDVSVDNGQRILAKTAIKGEQIKPDSWQDYKLEFNSDQLLTALECRVSFYPGVADLSVDVITVKPADSLAWYHPLKKAISGLWN
jgi:hypothetical protein